MSNKISRSNAHHAVVVLGMHRSGTSAMAGVLARLGCDLPEEIMPANEFNPKGYYESLKTYNMNDAVLASGGSGWDDWQAFNPGWFESPRMEEFLELGAQVLQEEYGTSRLFVLKDPRICRLMPFWTRLFEEQRIRPVYVLTHRNPVEVARSLETREGWPLSVGLLLWLRYVLDAEIGSRGAQRCFASYDQLLTGWSGVVAAIQSRTGLSFPRLSESVGAEITEFLSASLRHSVETLDASPIMSNWIRTTFGILERWADEGETGADYAKLDKVRAEFNVAAPMFSPLTSSLRAKSASADALKAEVEALRGQDEALGAEIAALQGLLDEARREAGQLRNDLVARQEALDALQEQRLGTERHNAQLAARLEESAQRLQELQQKLEKTEQDRWQTRSALEQRSQEAEDVGRQNRENAARVAELEGQIEKQREQQTALESAAEQARKSSRMMRIKLQEEFETEMASVLAAQRKHADEHSTKLRKKILDRSIAEREALAETLRQQQERIGELEQRAAAYANSTSWKLTAPLRRIVLALRGLA
jgi:hypothetical protein